MIRKYRIAVLVLTASALLAAACGNPETPMEIGFRRVALDLSFKDAGKAAPEEPQQIIRRFVDDDSLVRIVERAEEQEEEEAPEPRRVRRVRTLPPPPVKRECPEPPEGATPEYPTFAVVKDPPKVGNYPRHNEGTVNIQIATRDIPIPVPPLSVWQIPDVRFVKASTVISDSQMEELNPPAAIRENENVTQEVPEYELTRKLMPGFTVTDTYRYSDYLYLVKRVRVSRGVTETFEPSPPVRMVKLGVTEGAADSGNTHGGIDRKTNVAMTVESQIVERQDIDICGEVVQTYRIRIRERFVDLSKESPETSGNEGDTANFWNMQFDNGLLLVREEVNTTYHTSDDSLGAPVPVTVTYDYVSTLDSLEPEPLTPPATPGASAPEEEEEEEGEEE